MRRRDFVTLLGGAALAAPLAARAQQPEKLRRIGMLLGGAQNDRETQARLVPFWQALTELNWIDGRTLKADMRWGDADPARIAAYAAELAALAPDLIFGNVTPVLRALQKATQTVPIVFAGVSDPVGDGLVASLSRPGGNITGFSSFDPEIGGKWLQILKEISPGTARIGVIYNPDTAPHSIYLPVLKAAAPLFGVTLIEAVVRDPSGIESAIAALAQTRDAGLLVMPDTFTSLHHAKIIALAATHKTPAIYPFRFWAADGGLISYGTDLGDQYRRAAAYVDRILRGAKPADLPVQTPTKFITAINLKTAKALGIEIPLLVLARADEVIE